LDGISFRPTSANLLFLALQAFQEDWVGEAPPSSGRKQQDPQTAASIGKGLKDVRGMHLDERPESLDVVRPGRFFSTLLAMQAEFEQRLVSTGLGQGTSGEDTLRLLRQLEAIRSEALVALDWIQARRLDKNPASDGTAGVSGSSLLSEYEHELHG
jgi:hypothetical protein